jgi:hypothetical protein
MARLFYRPLKVAAIVTIFFSLIESLGAQAMMKGASPGAAPAMKPANQMSLAGTIGAINGNTVFLSTADGQARPIVVGKDTFILEWRLADLASIQPGDALGVAAAKASDGALTATVINIFPPEFWQVARKGQFPMDNGQVMTNAQVERLGSDVEGNTLYLKYEMLVAAIAVPATAVIHRGYVAKLSDLKLGMAVTVRGLPGADGTFAASSVGFDASEK